MTYAQNIDGVQLLAIERSFPLRKIFLDQSLFVKLAAPFSKNHL